MVCEAAVVCVGYLQQEGLSATSRAFILESPNLREYAEHSSEDGVIPACVFVRQLYFLSLRLLFDALKSAD